MHRSRRNILLSVLLGLAACGGGAEPVRLPAQFDGGQWRLVESAPDSNPPDVVKQLGLKSAVRARYQGAAGDLTVRAFRMAGQTSAFELVQKWRTEEGAMHFQNDDLFVVLEKPGAQPMALNAWAKALDQELRKK